MRKKRMQYAGKYVAGYGNTRRIHILMAERAIGKTLPMGAHVHHVNENWLDNRPENLVICPDAAYHKLLHRRTNALNACGNADWLSCGYCKQYDAPENLSVRRRAVRGCKTLLIYHKECNTASGKKYRAKLRSGRTDWIRGPRSDDAREKMSTSRINYWANR